MGVHRSKRARLGSRVSITSKRIWFLKRRSTILGTREPNDRIDVAINHGRVLESVLLIQHYSWPETLEPVNIGFHRFRSERRIP